MKNKQQIQNSQITLATYANKSNLKGKTIKDAVQSDSYNAILDFVIDLFEHWGGMFGAKLQDRRELDLVTAKMWASALVLLEPTQDELELSFAKSLTLEWPPTAAYDFINLSRSGVNSKFIDSNKAYYDAANNKYDHVVCYETAKRVGFYNMRNGSEFSTKSAWHKIYKDVCDEYTLDSSNFKELDSEVGLLESFDAYVAKDNNNSLERNIEIANLAISQIRNLL